MLEKISKVLSKNKAEKSLSKESEKEIPLKSQTQSKNMGQNESTVENKQNIGEVENKQNFGEAGKIFIGGLNVSTTDDSLKAYFSRFGKVLDSVVMKYPSGKSRGFGFVTFSTTKEADNALSKKHTLDGKAIDVKKFDRNESGKKPEKKENKFKVFVGGLPAEVSPENLTLFFERFGKVSEVIIPTDKVTKKQKGFGFVCFETEASAQKCLSCEFLHFGGRKIQTRAAEPRGNSKSGEVDEGCNDVDFNTPEAAELTSFKEKNSVPTSEDKCSSVASEERKERIGKEEPDINKMLADYFGKLAATFSELNNTNTTDKDLVDNNFSDKEKLLKEFMVELDNKTQTSGENLIEFSDNSESESEERNSSLDPDSSDDDSNGNAQNFTDETELIRLLSELVTPGRDSLLRSSENVSKENSGGKCDKKTAPSAPLKFVGNQGSLSCDLCEWTAEDNDFESFLKHCKTPSHRLKLKGRFSKNDNQTEECGPVGKGEEKAFRKPPVMIEGCSKQQSETLETKSKEGDGNQKQLKPIQKRKKVTQGNVKVANTTEAPKEVNSKEVNTEKQTKELKKLKVTALAKGMSSIQALPNGRLKCIMCEKMIPESMDFSLLMKNTTCHLQSKRHLEKLLKTEDSLKNLSEGSQEKSQNRNNEKDPPAIPNNTKKKTAKQKVDQNSKKQSIPQKSSNAKTQETAPKALMLCIPCNFFNKKIVAFASHLESSSHINCLTSKNLKTDISLNNMIICKYCNVILYGSLLCINTHYKKCLTKKNKSHEHLKS